MASAKKQRARETRFVRELQRVLDGLLVQMVAPAAPGFSTMHLAAQLEWIRPIMNRRCAVAAVWIGVGFRNLLMLHLAALTTGRALVRLVEAQNGPQAEATLALAARELLGTAYLFESKARKKVGRAVVRVVESVRDKLKGPVRARWSLVAGANIQGGLASFTGPSLKVGGQVALEGRLIKQLYLRVGLSVTAGTWRKEDDQEILGWTLSPGIHVYYGWSLGPMMLGPTVGVLANWSSLKMEIGGGSAQKISRWRIQTNVGAELRWPVCRGWALLGGAGIGLIPQQEAFVRAGDRSTILVTPLAVWWFRLGVLITL